MKCEEVRMQLAAYRRSEWSEAEQHAVSEHLAGCSACRRWEADARGVGDRLREMPTIVPPASLRANVFAAIRREQLDAATRAAETSRPAAASERPLPLPPAPVVRPRPVTPLPARSVAVATRPAARVGEIILGGRNSPRMVFGTRTAIATIAALFMIVFTARLIPFNTSQLVAGENLGVVQHPLHVFNILADPQYPKATSAIANKTDVIYVGQSSSGSEMLIDFNRNTGKLQYLFAHATNESLTLLALSDQLLVWRSADAKSWTVQAATLTAGQVQPFTSTTSPITLVAQGQRFGNSTVARFGSLSADGESIAFTAIDNNGAILLERADYAAGKPINYSFVAEAQTTHTLEQPYIDGNTIYWVDASKAADGSDMGVIWRQVGQQAAAPLSLNASAFGPVSAQGHLAWFQPSAATDAGTASLTTPLTGTINSRQSDSAAIQTLPSGTITADQIWRGPGYLMWRDSQGVHTYRVDVNDRGSTPIQLPNTFDTLGLSATTVAWVTPPADSAPGTPPSTIWAQEI